MSTASAEPSEPGIEMASKSVRRKITRSAGDIVGVGGITGDAATRRLWFDIDSMSTVAWPGGANVRTIWIETVDENLLQAFGRSSVITDLNACDLCSMNLLDVGTVASLGTEVVASVHKCVGEACWRSG